MMIGKSGSEAKSKGTRFWSAVLYYVTVLLLIILILFMYQKWSGRQQEFARLVEEASAQDKGFAIELRKETIEEDSDQESEVTIPELSDKAETPDL